MGTEPVRIKGHLAADTMIQRDRVPDKTKLIYLAVILTIAVLSAWSGQSGHSKQAGQHQANSLSN